MKSWDTGISQQIPKQLIKYLININLNSSIEFENLACAIACSLAINIKTKKPEFLSWKWINPLELPNIAVSFKVDLYKKLIKQLKLLNFC